MAAHVQENATCLQSSCVSMNNHDLLYFRYGIVACKFLSDKGVLVLMRISVLTFSPSFWKG